MITLALMPRLKGVRFPREIVFYAVWVYHRFALNTADVEDLFAERGVIVTRVTIRRRVNRFGCHFMSDVSANGTDQAELTETRNQTELRREGRSRHPPGHPQTVFGGREDHDRAATSTEFKDLRREARDLKEVLAEQAPELRLLKKA